MTRALISLTLLLILAPSGASAQWYTPGSGIPYYTFPDSPPRPVVRLSSSYLPIWCPGNNRDFAMEAETLISSGIDRQRAQFAPGAPPLTPDPDLIRIAERRSCDMAQGLASFSHLDAAGHFIAGEMVRERFGPYGVTGENIMETDGSRNFGAKEFAGAAINGWMNSPEHRSNILDPDFTASGVGVAKFGTEAVATQLFHGPAQEHADPDH